MQNKNAEQKVIEGYVESIIFRNEDNGYTVLNLVTDGHELTCVGVFEVIAEGEMLELTGEYVEHAMYGQQFKIQTYATKIPEDTIAIERYLGSGAIKGIGAALATRIVRRFGADTMRIMDEEPERLAEVKGISEKKAREIAIQVAEKSEMRQAMMFLQQYGISISLGVKIYAKYGVSLYSVLKENPYRLADDIQGIGFRIADEIAGKIGIHADSDYRIRSGIFYVLTLAAAEGHVYLPQNLLLSRAEELLGVDASYMEKHIMDLAIERKIIIKEEMENGGLRNIYTRQAYYLELDTARQLLELNIQSEEEEEKIRRRLISIEKKNKLELEEMQRQAVVEAVKNGVLILTGGPGTGKSATRSVVK